MARTSTDKGLGYVIESWGGMGQKPYEVYITREPDGQGRIITYTPYGVKFFTVREARDWAKIKSIL